MFSIVAEELFLEDLPVVDSASAAYSKRQSSEPFSCEQQSRCPYLEFICIMFGTAETNKNIHCLYVPLTKLLGDY